MPRGGFSEGKAPGLPGAAASRRADREQTRADPSPGTRARRRHSAPELERRREVPVAWASAADGIRLEGTLYLPPESGAYAAIIYHYGSNAWEREPWNYVFWRFNQEGVAVLSYDKRGVGASAGECCPWREPGYFERLAADLIGGVRAIAEHPEIDPERIGLGGVSQGGWIVPLAAASAPDEVAFTVIASGPAVSVGEELLYSDLTGDARCDPTGLSAEEIARRMDQEEPSGFDPRPHLEVMRHPALWQFCENDTSVPVERSIRILEAIDRTRQLDFSIQRFTSCNHQFVDGGGMCQGEGRRVNWWDPLLIWMDAEGLLAHGGSSRSPR